MEDETLIKLSNWVKECDGALFRFASLTQKISEQLASYPEQSFSIGALFTACLRTSGSALILVENGRVWDADILMRSTMEGSIKSIFLLSNKDLFDERYKEFSDTLFDIEGIKQHAKAEALLKVIKDSDSDQWRPIREMLLPESMRDEISKKYPRSTRRAIETKWGFTGLIEQLSKEDIPAANLFVMLLHGYSMASHHLHADYTGVCSALERDYRDEKKMHFVYTAHAARIVSDAFWLSYARVHAAYKFFNISVEPLQKLIRDYEDFNNELSQSVDEWGRVEYEKI